MLFVLCMFPFILGHAQPKILKYVGNDTIVIPDPIYTDWPEWFIVDGEDAYIVMEEGDTVKVKPGWRDCKLKVLWTIDEPYYDARRTCTFGHPALDASFPEKVGGPIVRTSAGWMNLNHCSRKLAYAMMIDRRDKDFDEFKSVPKLMKKLKRNPDPDKLPYKG